MVGGGPGSRTACRILRHATTPVTVVMIVAGALVEAPKEGNAEAATRGLGLRRDGGRARRGYAAGAGDGAGRDTASAAAGTGRRSQDVVFGADRTGRGRG